MTTLMIATVLVATNLPTVADEGIGYFADMGYDRSDGLVDFHADFLVRHVAAQPLFNSVFHVGIVVDRPHNRRELRVA